MKKYFSAIPLYIKYAVLIFVISGSAAWYFDPVGTTPAMLVLHLFFCLAYSKIYLGKTKHQQ